MDRKPWQREVECGNCGGILTIFKEDVKFTRGKGLYEEPAHTFYYAICDGCRHPNELKRLPNKIEDAAQMIKNKA